MKKSILLMYAIFIAFGVNAQLLDHNWYFSNSSKGLFFDFSTNAVSVTNEHASLSQTGTGVASDSTSGAVMFYTNGVKVWDASHQIMPNGINLSGGLSCTQTGLVCYVPGQANRYYVFSNNADQPVPGNVSFSIVDKSLPGNGDLINPKGDIDINFKNIAITDSSSEGMTIVSGANNNFWLLIPKAYSNEIRVFSITVNGINYFNSYYVAHSLISPTSIRYSKESGKLAIGSMIESDPVIICDFDYINGIINNDYIMPGSPFGTNSTQAWYGIVDFEWSGNGSKLYISKYRDYTPGAAGKLYQYDLNNPANNASLVYSIPTSQFSYIGFGLKRGSDDKIYYLYTNTQFADCRYLGVINSPDSLGSLCDINPMGIDLGSLPANNHKFPEFLLPLHISIPELTILASSTDATNHGTCDGTAIATVSGGVAPYSYIWSNGDTLSSLNGLCAGSYLVTVTDANSISVFTSVTINEPAASYSLDYIWYFSTTQKGLYFDLVNDNVSITNDHAPMDAGGGNGVAVDSLTGNVMFYSNGFKVWDKTHQLMPNGTNLNGDINTVQNGLVSYIPGHPNKYYVFSNNGESPNAGNAYYSIVDMSLPGNGTVQNPLGDIDINNKNILFANSTSEGMMIVPGIHNNLWLIVPKFNSDELRLFEITENGIQLTSTYNTGHSVQIPVSVKYSSTAGKIAIGSMVETDPVVICDFNSNSGTFSNSISIPGTPFGTSTTYWHGVFDLEWSANGSKLYISKYRDSNPATSGKMYQYDLQNPSSAPVLVYAIPSTQFSYLFKGLKRGPNNKIYFMYVNAQIADTRYIGEINNPDLAGTACNVNPTAIDMGISLGNTHKFPEFLVPYQNIAITDSLTATITSTNVSCNGNCDGSASVTVAGGMSPYMYLWNTGHVTSDINNLCAGTYTVTIYDNAQNSIVQNITITEPSVLTINIADIQATGCNGENNGSATVVATGGVSPYTFIWNGMPGVNSQIANNLSAGSYNVMVVDSNGCNSSIIAVIPSSSFGTITGIAQFSLGFIGSGDGIVHLYKANVPGFYEVDSSAIFENGAFILNHIPAGEYFLYVKMDNHSNNPDYNLIHNTYYDSTYKWFDATILNIACGDSINLVVNMYEKSTGGGNGNGNITGNIHYNSNNKSINGEPVPGACITLEQEPDDNPIASTNSDITGFYEFLNIAEGSYSIYIDIPGLPHISTYYVNVTSTDTVFPNLNFVVDTVSTNPGIYGDSTVYANNIAENVSISVYPNPFIDNINVQYKVTRKGNIEIELIDIEGRIIDSFSKAMDSGSYNYELKGLSNLNSGIYILKTVVDNNIYIKKLIKN